MERNFTLLFLLQHYPAFHHFQAVSFDDVAAVDAEVADLMCAAEQQASSRVMNCINTCAAEAVRH